MIRLFVIICVWLAGVLCVAAQTNPVKVATGTRFDLFASASVGSISNGQIVTGDGSIDRQTWLPASDQPRSYTCNLSAPHFGWTELAIRFIPVSNGTVDLTLLGPWEQSPLPGNPIYQQEVLWDTLSATNSTLTNGSFESVGGNGVPVGWTRPYGTNAAVVTNPVPPVDGLRYARTWHDSPFACTLSVTSGLPVTLKLYSRAYFPTNFTDMARITDSNSPAHLAARKFMRGANLGNYLEAPPGEDWGASYSNKDFITIRAEGFDHVRLPIAWHYYTGPAPNYTISNSIYAKADFLVTNALGNGLGVLVNIHHFNDFISDPPTYSNKFYAIWQQLAAHYSNYPSGVAFELLNEPNGAATTQTLNPIYAEAIRRIRLSNTDRTIFVGPSQWNSIDELANLQLPNNDSNLVVTVHCYDPFLFTHQGANWAGPDTATTNILFPGPPPVPLAPAPGVASWVTNWISDYNTQPAEFNPCSPRAFRGRMQLARQWSDYYGRPMHVGEFGAYDTYCDAVSRVRFITAIRGTMDSLGLGWAMWDWKAGFHYWVDDGGGRPDPPGMREALFPKPELKLNDQSELEHDGAVAKTYRIQRAAVLTTNTAWSNLATQTLTQPRLLYPVSATNANPAVFYRIEWVK